MVQALTGNGSVQQNTNSDDADGVMSYVMRSMVCLQCNSTANACVPKNAVVVLTGDNRNVASAVRIF
jgi:hypothetical protein